ncbi:hypothetical protein CLOP_g8635 [Closterium sp. NIES-67]|nr:hypothetical protein CLOP_g2164 [Closterium sp. NIES-67]GJP78309.1 hypothetical protein CLOP_g8635 [Closterium sp. NIES-67]
MVSSASCHFPIGESAFGGTASIALGKRREVGCCLRFRVLRYNTAPILISLPNDSLFIKRRGYLSAGGPVNSSRGRSLTCSIAAKFDAFNEDENATSGDSPLSSAPLPSSLQSSPDWSTGADSGLDDVSPACPVPDFTALGGEICLFRPQEQSGYPTGAASGRPLLVYLPGMDGTGQCLQPQIRSLTRAGFDIRSLYIPTTDRSTWRELVRRVTPLIQQAASEGGEGTREVTVLAESFGACLALRIAAANPTLFHRLVLINPATAFPSNNPLVSLCVATGLLAIFPPPLYEFAQDVALPLLVKRSRVQPPAAAASSAAAGGGGGSKGGGGGALSLRVLSPIDYVPAACASWRLSLLNDQSGLSDGVLKSIHTPTLLIASSKDRVLPAVPETGRLLALLPNSKRVILPSSGHTVLLEADVDIAAIIQTHGFAPTNPVPPLGRVAPSNVFDSQGYVAADGTSAASAANVFDSQGYVAASAAGAASAREETRLQTGKGEVLTAAAAAAAAAAARAAAARAAAARAGAAPSPASGGGTESEGEAPGRGLDEAAHWRERGGERRRRRRRKGRKEFKGRELEKLYEDIGRSLDLWRTLVSPLVVGEGNLQRVQRELARQPDRSVLFVGNHTIYGFYDTPLLLYELYMRGFKCRCLAHPSFWLQQSLGELLESFGHVKPSPRALYNLLKEGGPVLVFPGGSRETCRLKGEKYQLMWGADAGKSSRSRRSSDRREGASQQTVHGDSGLIRMAAKLDTIIVPFAMVGADDAYDIAADRSDILSSPIGPPVRGLYESLNLNPATDVSPMTVLPGTSLPSLIPLPSRLERVYFYFGTPIDFKELPPSAIKVHGAACSGGGHRPPPGIEGD